MSRDPKLIEVPYPSISWVENKREKCKLDVGNYIRNIQLFLELQVDSDATWTGFDEDNPLKILKNIELYGLLKSGKRGRISFYDLGADLLYYYSYFMAATAGHRDQKPSAISQTDVNPQVRLELNFLPRFVIDTNKFSELWLRVLWGDGDDLAVPAGCTTVDWGELYIQSEEYTTPPRKLMGWHRELSEKSKNVAAVGKDAIELPKSMQYRQLMVEVINNSIRSDALVSNLALKYGRTKTAIETDYMSLKVKNKSQYKVETLEAGYVTVEGIVMFPMRQLINPIKYETFELEYTNIAPTATATVRTLIDRVAPL